MEEVKKGDIVGKDKITRQGEAFAHGFNDRVTAQDYINKNNLHAYIESDTLNPGKLAILATNTNTFIIEAIVNWVVGDEMAVTFDTGGSEIVNWREQEGWKILKSASPSFQSSVVQMTDDDLRNSINSLREARRPLPSQIKRKTSTKMPKITDPMELALSKMSPDKRLELQKKLGLVD